MFCQPVFDIGFPIDFGNEKPKRYKSLPQRKPVPTSPAVAYMQLRRTMATQPSLATFSALWLQGICAFFFGGAIMAALCYAAMRWIWPGFIIDQVQTVIEIYGAVNDPEAQDIARTLQRLMDSHSLPSAIDIALELLYVAVFTGSLLSMLLSLIIRKTRRLKPPQFKQ